MGPIIVKAHPLDHVVAESQLANSYRCVEFCSYHCWV